MLQVHPNTAERAPQALAETLAALLTTVTNDAEIAAILAQAKQAMASVAWNRYAARVSRESATQACRRHMRRWHQHTAATPGVAAPSSPEAIAHTEALKAEIIGDMIRGRQADA